MWEDKGRRIFLPGHGSIGQSWLGCGGVLEGSDTCHVIGCRVDVADLAGEEDSFLLHHSMCFS